MPILAEMKIDWTAFAALTALAIWLVDGYRRRRERRASRRLLAQIMTAPLAVAQLEIAKLRSLIVPPGGGDTTYLLRVLNYQIERQNFASKASLITLELPSQFLDKADILSEVVSNRLALAFAQVNRLRSLCQYFGEVPDEADEEEITQSLKLVITQIQDAEQSIGEAFQALLHDGRASARFQRPNSR
ncbi:hypothetical protein LP085_21110 [Achromobacter sp. MY14]|uniref:hypothetical protein n=1 Tax=unclassified Achromobacter TaxID=2626865 RepID=UPI001E5A07E0|nr:hypothetical protein [Achromobacter sp. MY14]MCD0499373.1 hypothetical protein [Achromobacter sp. MY14]